jgi:transketolase
MKRSVAQLEAIARGGYILSEGGQSPRAVLIATGSEVPLAVDAQKLLAASDIAVRVVSMPSTTVFDRQDAAYREAVLPRGIPRVAVEAGVSDFWRKYVGLEGAVVGIDRYGESAPAEAVFEFFGFSAENVAKTVREIL